MKKLCFLLLMLILTFFFSANAQIQRLALLPSSMRLGEDFAASLCIDFFKEAPGIGGSSTSYRNFQNLDGSAADVGRSVIEADDFKKIRIPSTNEQTLLLLPSDNSGPVAAKYKDFIKHKI